MFIPVIESLPWLYSTPLVPLRFSGPNTIVGARGSCKETAMHKNSVEKRYSHEG